MSTRNTKESSVRTSSKRINSLPRRRKYSSLSTTRGPDVCPDSANRSTKSTSDEKFNSRPPNFPMPSTINGTTSPLRPRGLPKIGVNVAAAAAAAARIQASARSETTRSVSATLARPAIARQAMRSIARRRQIRKVVSAPCAAAPAAVACSYAALASERSVRLLVLAEPRQGLWIAQQRRGDEFAAGEDQRQFVGQSLRKSCFRLASSAGVSAARSRQCATDSRRMSGIRSHAAAAGVIAVDTP